MHYVLKKDENDQIISIRIVGDYRKLNQQTVPDHYSVPNIRDFSSNLHNKKYFTTLDLQSAFHHIP
ncbi:reverse transcriptase domain-containing protein, partial [Clostridioides difficile]|uniref:reverse transcriptase domain-containing protein n=1 Tax=Clostridioides difficile TaxID=1496 RepID=UPI0021148E56